MSRKFVGFVEYAWDDFSIFGRDAETSTLDVVKKTMDLSKKYDNLHYKIIKDSPFEAVVFATDAFTEEEGEAWYEKWSNEEEHYVYEKLEDFLNEDSVNIHRIHLMDVLDGELDEYVIEDHEVTFIFRFDKILVVSRQNDFITFSIRTDKLYRWFLNDEM